MKRIQLPAFFIVFLLLLSACTDSGATPSTSGKTDEQPTQPQGQAELFTDRELSGSYDTENCAHIELNGKSATASSNAVQIDGSIVTILDEGTYVLTGTLENGMIIVDAAKEDKTQLVLDNAEISCADSASIYVRQADKVFITLADGSANRLSNGGVFDTTDENNIDAVIFSKEDLCLNGSGSLSITSPVGHGIVSKDELTLAGGGSYTIECASHGLSSKDNICIENIHMTISAGKDGIKAEHDEDAALGYIYLQDGTYDITCEGDGISAGSTLTVADGTYTILSGGGSANAEQKISEDWGFMGGGRGGGMGGFPGGMGGENGGSSDNTEGEDSASAKGLKASTGLTVLGGAFTLDCADDAVHSNADLLVKSGSFSILTGDDGFHADGALSISSGTIHVEESYEGLEGLSIDITGGDISLTATDDGLNAAGGSDQSGFGGPRGGDVFGGTGSSSDSYIRISGGTLEIRASGDGIDSNGTLSINGGHTTVCGPVSGDTAVLDYEISGEITGGTFIGTGAYQMAQTFSDSKQGVIAVSVGNQAAATPITLTDSSGTAVLSYTPSREYAIVILSSPELIKGETYTITVGELSGSFAAS